MPATPPEFSGAIPPTPARVSWAPGAVAIALHAIMLVLYLKPWGFDPGALVCASKTSVARPEFSAVRVSQGTGYDGQAFFVLGQRPPWKPVVPVDLLDTPARHTRILYPAAAWAVSGGDPHRLLFALSLLNLLAVGVLAYAGSRMAQGQGLSAWWGLLLPFAVNAALPLFRDLSDLISITLVACVLVGWVERWSGLPIFGVALLAFLTRETNLFPLAALGLISLVQRRWTTALALLAAAGTWALWAAYVAWLYGIWPFLPAQGNFDLPMSAWLKFWIHPINDRILVERTKLFLAFGLPVLVLAGLLLRHRCEQGLLAVALVGVVLAAMAGPSIWVDYWSYARTLNLLPLAVWLVCIHTRSTKLAAVVSLAGGISLLTTYRYMMLPTLPS